jgi:hypothetical protein
MKLFIAVIASEAKQSRAAQTTLDCFVALLLAMTTRKQPTLIRYPNRQTGTGCS